MFDGHYIEWRNRRLAVIVNHFGTDYFKGKKILELGSGYGTVGYYLYTLGADVTCVEGRKEFVDEIKDRYPQLKAICLDLDISDIRELGFFDMIIDMSLICHIKNHERHFAQLSQQCKYLVLETEILDSNDPELSRQFPEKGYDKSLCDMANVPSYGKVERLLFQNKFIFTAEINSELDSPGVGPSWSHHYTWPVVNDGHYKMGQRRMYFAKRMKRAAICLSGFMRSFEGCHMSLHNKLIIPNIDWEVDKFIHSWQKGDWRDTKAEAIKHRDRILECYKPVKAIFEPKVDFDISSYEVRSEFIHGDGKHIPSMFYKILACNILKRNYEIDNCFKYDLVIRARSDLIYKNELFFDDYLNQINTLFLPDHGHWNLLNSAYNYDGINDQFAISNSSISDIYSSLFAEFDSLVIKKGQPFDHKIGCAIKPECLLKYYIQRKNIVVKFSKIPYYILRTDGTKFFNIGSDKWA